jgi:hypothetical protein
MSMTIALALMAQGTAAAPTPDYRDDASWLCRPGRADACADNQDVTVIAADGAATVEPFKAATDPAYDCFYVYPTVSLDTTPNSDMVIGPEERRVAYAQTARFASQCRVFAPMYRQVTLTALRSAMMGQPLAADRAMALKDVTAAWEDYLARDNNGRGVVLIGHSQGSGVLKAMLAQSVEGKPVQGRIISAMLIGTNVVVPKGKTVGGDLKHMPICTSSTETGCVVSYVTFRSDAPPPANSRFGKAPAADMAIACTNPGDLSGKRVVADAIFTAGGPGDSAQPMTAWSSSGARVETPFVRTPGLISTECVSKDGFDYLSVTVNADPGDPRTDTISGDVVANGAVLKDWGLHLIDMPVVMGDLLRLANSQAVAWQSKQPAE